MDDATADEYIETLLRHFVGQLSEWEDGFVRDLRQWRQRGRSLSPRQADKLDTIMERCARSR